MRRRPAQARSRLGLRRREEHRGGGGPFRGGSVGVFRGPQAAGFEGGRGGGSVEGDRRAAPVPGIRRPLLPVPGPAGPFALRRRGAAHPAGEPARRRAVRDPLRARRAFGGPPRPRQRPPDRDAQETQGPREQRAGRRTRRGHHPGRRLGGRSRSGSGGRRRSGGLLGPAPGAAPLGHPDRPLPLRPGEDPRPGRKTAAFGRPQGLRGRREQPRPDRRLDPPGRLHRRDRRFGRGQELPGHRHPEAGPVRAPSPREAETRALRPPRGRRAARQGHPRGPEPHRPDAAFQPGDLHGGLRP